MKIKIFLLGIIFLSLKIYPQNEYVPAENPVYQFLKSLSVRGIIVSYNDAIIPFTRKDISSFLTEAVMHKDRLSSTEQSILYKYSARFSNGKNVINLADSSFAGLFSKSEKRLYFYDDSLAYLAVSPLFELADIYSGANHKNAFILNFGADAHGSYSDWFGFSVSASNAYVSGDRNAALEDNRVRQSFTFNKTRLNFFDETRGHLTLASEIFKLQFGRERILWGTGSVNRMILSENPPAFDMLRMNLTYKSLSFDFLHGWLVQPPRVIHDSAAGDVKYKQSKYIAVNRFGLNFRDVNFGITQAIIYSNRPVEAAYLNPFLLWESAQRSLNDLDNSFLTVDAEIKAYTGLTLSGTYLFDDINFNLLKDWNNISNRSAWQLSTIITYPFIFRDFTLRVDYSQVRPYTFSHRAAGESLTYTNNGYLLGYSGNPNSATLNLQLLYNFNEDLNCTLAYQYFLHGSNVTDSRGVLIRNVGGDVFRFFGDYDSDKTFLFDGISDKYHLFSFEIDYEFLRNMLLTAANHLKFSKTGDSSDSLYSLIISLKLFYE